MPFRRRALLRWHPIAAAQLSNVVFDPGQCRAWKKSIGKLVSVFRPALVVGQRSHQTFELCHQSPLSDPIRVRCDYAPRQLSPHRLQIGQVSIVVPIHDVPYKALYALIMFHCKLTVNIAKRSLRAYLISCCRS